MSACFEDSRADPSGTSLDSRFLSAGQVVLCCIDGEAAVDVVVTPAKVKPGTWTLSDRLGRPLGTITETSPSLFVNRGVEMLLLVRDGGQWRIVSQTWDTESPSKPIPAFLTTNQPGAEGSGRASILTRSDP
jgi:hypothetical protein